MKHKRIISAICAAVTAVVSASPALAVESWRDAFVTRLMKTLSVDPTYTDIAITDLNADGMPEAWVIKNSPDGGIGTGITFENNSIVTVNTPKNVIGTCLEDITVYNENGNFLFVGKEVGRYTSALEYYLLEFDGATLTASPTDKTVYSKLTAEPYKDFYGTGFVSDGLPSRAKLKEFIDSYTPAANTLSASVSDASVTVNGVGVRVSGISVNNSNYYKIRDIAMMLRSTSARFDVTWDDSLNAVNIKKGQKYNVVGGELEAISSDETLEIFSNESPIYIDGAEVHLQSYNVNSSNYFRIRDLADYLDFSITWDEAAQTVGLVTD